jgi:hypothetical protein
MENCKWMPLWFLNCSAEEPGGKIVGTATVLIFPDLNSGNIASRLVRHIARAMHMAKFCWDWTDPQPMYREARVHMISWVLLPSWGSKPSTITCFTREARQSLRASSVSAGINFHQTLRSYETMLPYPTNPVLRNLPIYQPGRPSKKLLAS